MAIESTDDLKDLPHVVILRRGNELTIREFGGAGCMERAHDYAQREALGARDVEALVAMRYRRIGGPDVPIAAALADPADSVVAARYVRAAELDRLRNRVWELENYQRHAEEHQRAQAAELDRLRADNEALRNRLAEIQAANILVGWVETDGEVIWHDRAAATGRNLYVACATPPPNAAGKAPAPGAVD